MDGVGESSSRRGSRIKYLTSRALMQAMEVGESSWLESSLVGRKKKEHKFCCYSWLAPASSRAWKAAESSVQEEFPLTFPGTSP